MSQQKIIVSVTNDLTTDQRVAKICNTLIELNFEVVLVGRKLPNSQPLSRIYKTKLFNLIHYWYLFTMKVYEIFLVHSLFNTIQVIFNCCFTSNYY